MKQLQGCGTALITPFNKKGDIDYKTFRKLVKRQILSGVDFLVVSGSTGEDPCLTNDEKTELVKICVEEVKGKMPVFAGVGSNSTRNVIENINRLKSTGVNGFLIATPYYNRPTQKGLYNHFKEIATSTKKPVILYNVPSRTAVNLNAETCLKLAEIKNIIAVKEASGNYPQISEIIRNAPKNFAVFSGNDDETFLLMATGAKGIISIASNIAPKEVTALTKAMLKNDLVNGRKLHHKLFDLFTNCFIETNPIPVKAGMYRLKLINNILRSPLSTATKKTENRIAKTIKALGIKK